MTSTTLNHRGRQFLINGQLTYTELPHSHSQVHGLLMNARFIQGIFDDAADRDRYQRFGSTFDPEDNTRRLAAALPAWYSYGLRAFTVGLQGGGPCFTTNNDTIHNNPFGDDGRSLDPKYASRLDGLIRKADACGMVVIVSFFYGAQARRLQDDAARQEAVRTASRFLKDGGYTNVIIEVANEHNIDVFRSSPNLYDPHSMADLMALARRESGGLLVGCSGGGGYTNKTICEASDVVLIHGNGCSRQGYYQTIQQAKEWAPNKPIVCNEDSQAIGQLEVAFRTRTSWGYYNNMTKQEPPADWGITPGEDTFFAHRMAEGIGIDVDPIPEGDQYYLQGLEPDMHAHGQRWIRLASLYPERINYVDFYCNGELVDTCYDEPFSLFFKGNWMQGAWPVRSDDRQWKAVVHLRDGQVLERTVDVEGRI